MRAAALLIRCAWFALALCVGCRGVSDPAADRQLPPVVVRPLEVGESALYVGALGDTGTGRWDQYDVAEAMATRVEREPWDFVLLLGDNFYPSGVESVDDPQWEDKFEDVYAQPSLVTLPFYALLGNHDHKGNVHAQVEYSARSPRWRMPATHYTFTETLVDGTQVQFWMLDTQIMAAGNPAGLAQRTWLQEGLAASTADWKIACGHVPVYSSCSKRPNYRTELAPFIEETFVAGGVDLYLAGHDHVLELTPPKQGVRYVTSGAGAGPDKAYAIEWTSASDYAATCGGFVVLRFTQRDLVLEFVRLDGETEYAATLPRGDR